MSNMTNHEPQPASAPDATLQAVLRRYQQAMLDQSADDLADLYATDALHELPFLFPGMPPRYEGREEVRAAYRAAWSGSFARPGEVRVVAIHQTEDPEVIVAEQVVAGTNASTGERFEFPGVLVLRVRDGYIIEVRDYMDGLAVARAMHRLPAVVEALTDS
jgi:ketosteroid isomerase-like protein